MTQNNNSTRSIVEHENGPLRVLGPPCSGKTSVMLERFRWLESRGLHPAIIAYTRDHRDRLVEALLPDGSARLGRVPVWTFPQLSNELLRAAQPSSRSPLSELEEHVLLERIIAQTTLRSDYANLSASDALRETLLSAIHFLLQNNVDPGIGASGDDRLDDILALYRACREQLTRTGNITFYDVAWKAAAALEAGGLDHPIRAADVLLIDDFNDVDAGQFELLLRLAPPGGATSVNVFGDPSGARFRFRGTSESFLNEYFPARYQPQDAALAHAPALVPAGEGQLGLFDGPARGAPDRVGVSGAAIAEDEIAEARWVVDVTADLLVAGTEPGEIAVVVRDARRYRAVLTRAFDDAGVPFDAEADRVGPAERLVLGLMRGLGSRDVDAAEILRDSPLYRRVFDAFSEALELETCRQTLKEAGRLAGHIRKSSFAGGKRFSMSRFMACISAVIDGAGTGERERTRLEGLREEWYGYAEMTTRLGGTPALAGFLRLRRSGASKPAAPRGGAVRMFTPREASGRSFDAVILAGCAEGVFPMVESVPGYVPWARLEGLTTAAAYPVELQGNRSRERLLDDERTLFDATLRRARTHLYLSAPEKLEGEAVVAPSDPARPFFAGAVRVPRRQGLAERAARTVQRGRLTGAISPGLPAAGRIEQLWLSDRPGALAFSLEPFALSPSRLGILENCERRFFYTRVLDLDTDDSVALRLGSWVHDTLEALVAEGDDGDTLRAKLDEDTIDALAGEVARKAEEGAVMAGSIQTHVAGLLAGFRRLEGDRTPIRRFEASEWRFEFEAGGFRFSGRADRVDRLADGGFVVVDYKTGFVPATAKTVRRNIAEADRGAEKRDWQVALYSRAVQSEYGEAPRSFCYYHLAPGRDVNAIEIRIGEGEERSAAFSGIDKKRLGAVSEAEVAAIVDRGVALAGEVFAAKTRFERTEARSRCRNCPFERVCERDE